MTELVSIVSMLHWARCAIVQHLYKLLLPVKRFETCFESLEIVFNFHKQFGIDDVHE